MYRDEQLASSLAKEFDEFDYVMIDTCSMMEEPFPSWLEIFEKSKKYANQFHPLIVLKQCHQELKKHLKGKIPEKKRTAKLALEILKTAKKNKTVTITRYKNRKTKANFGDHALFSKVNDDHLDFHILVITQDKKLATDLLHLNDLFSQNGKPVVVKKFGHRGDLIPNKGVADLPSPSKPNPSSIPTKKEHPLVISDRRLSAVMGNSNYPNARKIADVRAQLSALSKTDSRIKKSLTLNYSEEKLQAWLLAHAEPKPTPKKEEPKAEPKQETKPISLPKPEPVPSAPKAREYVGYGKDEKSAFIEAALNAGIIVRDHGVPYVPIVHGPLDLDTRDLANLLQTYEKGAKKPFDFKDLHISFFGEEGRMKASIYYLSKKNEPTSVVEKPPKKVEEKKPAKIAPEVKPEPKKEEPKPAEKKADKQPPKPKQKQAKSVTEKPKPEQVKPALKKEEAKPVKAEQKQAKPQQKASQSKPEQSKPEPKKPEAKKEGSGKKQPSNKPKKEAAKPEPQKGPTLIVAIPDDPKVAERIEKDTSAASSKKQGKKPSSKGERAKPKQQPKPAAEKAKPEGKKEEPKPSKKPQQAKKGSKTQTNGQKPKPDNKTEAAKKQPESKKNGSSKPQEPSPKKEGNKHPQLLEQAKTAEARLMAVLPNSSYPEQKKAKDVQAQLSLIAKLSKEERASLRLSQESLQKSLAGLQNAKKG